MASWARGGAFLQTWAKYVLGLLDVDLGALEDYPSGELILAGIWDAAAGEAVTDQSLDAARAAVE
ncbi:MAG: hypothetical protein R3249_05030 [Nitriliruptorales bacterium]|nr:hypothetical protein [Nitriliruptorales bacterium]